MRLHPLMVLSALLLAPTVLPAQRPLDQAEQDSVRRWIAALQPEIGQIRIRPDRMIEGGRLIPEGMHVRDDVISYRGDLDVHGTIEGNAIAFGADVVLRPTAHVHGDVLALGGRVRDEGGRADGEVRAVSGHEKGMEALFATRADATRGPRALLSLVAGWFAVLTAISFAVLMLARTNLIAISQRIRGDFGRSLLVGLVAQLALVPVLMLLVVGLAITIIGVLLIPFALVAYLLALIGVCMLGFLAMACANGRALRRRDEASAQDETVGDVTAHLMIGLAAYFALWAVAAVAGPLGIAGSLLRAMVVILTWVAVTVGFGAAILSRGGTRAPKEALEPEPAEDEYSWQTPTPVSGVTAARRPTPAARPTEWK